MRSVLGHVAFRRSSDGDGGLREVDDAPLTRGPGRLCSDPSLCPFPIVGIADPFCVPRKGQLR